MKVSRSKWMVAVASLGGGLAGGIESTSVAQDEGGEALVERPAYSFLRHREDWSVLARMPEDQKTDFWDPIKHVPLSDDGSVWASFGGSVRLRLEGWSDFGFGAAADPNDVFLLSRILTHADVHVGERVRVFVEGKSALSTDRDLPGGRRTVDVDTLDLQQAFADIAIPFGDASITLRPGRQELLLGKQRLVSPLGWSNTLRTWDGVSVLVEAGGWRVHAFWAQFAPVRKYDFNEADAQTQLFGAYATGRIFDDHVGLDVYFLGLDRDDARTFNGTTGDEERFTIGGRVFGDVGDTTLDYDFEGAYQFGEVGSGDVSAFMIGSELGWRLPDAWGTPRLFLGFDYGSGDDGAGGDVETFNQLFPLGHAYLGYIDVVGRQNIIDLSAGSTVTLMPKVSARVAGHFYWRADTSDALYNAGGGVVRAGSLASDRTVGQEIDLTFTYRFDRHLKGQLGYSHFFAGDFIDESGANDDIDFAYVQLLYTF